MKYFILALIVIFGAAAYLVSIIPHDLTVEIPNEVIIVRNPNKGQETSLIAEYNDHIRVISPKQNTTSTSPLTVSGEARGYWYFEASFPISVVDWNGQIIGEGYATALTDWMTEDYVPFSGDIEFDTALIQNQYSASGTVIFSKANASGLPEHDDAFEIPITFEL